MEMQNYFIFGCGIYINKGISPQHTFWIEDKISGNSEVLYVNFEQYFRNTTIDTHPEKSVILQCDNCTNNNCKYHKSYNNNEKAIVNIDKLFQPDPFQEKRKYKRMNLMLSIKLFNLANLSDKEKVDPNDFINAKITNLSSSGCNISFDKLPEELIPDVESDIEIVFQSDVIVRDKGSSTGDSKFYNLQSMAPFIGEIVWRVQYSCGIEFVSMKKEDRFTIENMIGDLYSV